MNSTIEKNKATATRFIEAFNTADWDTVREVVTPNYVFHHPVGGTVQAGPGGMVAAWSDFKARVARLVAPDPGDDRGGRLPGGAAAHLRPFHRRALSRRSTNWQMVGVRYGEHRAL